MYTPDDYDKHSCLKPSLGLYIAILFSMKDVVLIIVEALSQLKAKGGPNRLEYFQDLVQPEMIIVNIIGLLLFMSFMKREPKEQGFWKKISENGRLLLIFALSLHLAILGVEQALQMSEAYRWYKGINMSLIYMMFVDLIFILYAASSQRVRDTFADWPNRKLAG